MSSLSKQHTCSMSSTITYSMQYSYGYGYSSIWFHTLSVSLYLQEFHRKKKSKKMEKNSMNETKTHRTQTLYSVKGWLFQLEFILRFLCPIYSEHRRFTFAQCMLHTCDLSQCIRAPRSQFSIMVCISLSLLFQFVVFFCVLVFFLFILCIYILRFSWESQFGVLGMFTTFAI